MEAREAADGAAYVRTLGRAFCFDRFISRLVTSVYCVRGRKVAGLWCLCSYRMLSKVRFIEKGAWSEWPLTPCAAPCPLQPWLASRPSSSVNGHRSSQREVTHRVNLSLRRWALGPGTQSERRQATSSHSMTRMHVYISKSVTASETGVCFGCGEQCGCAVCTMYVGG